MSGKTVTPDIWLAIGHGEGGAQMRLVHNDAEMVQWLWEQCGPNHTGKEDDSRNEWFSYLEDGDNWRDLDDVPRWWCSINVGETGHIEFIRLLDLTGASLRDEWATAMERGRAALSQGDGV